jgi:hypothetical protein
MKKILIRIALVVVLLGIAAVVAIGLSLNGAIKKGVETFGPQIAKVDVKLDGVKLSIFSGSGSIKGLVIGNPEGYKTPEAMSVGLASVAVVARFNFFRQDCGEIHSHRSAAGDL